MAKKKQRDELVFLEDILDCIDKIAEYVKGISENDFEKNIEKQDAIIRRIEIIGEATKRISTETRSQYSSIPWREMAGMRDIVIHEYFGITTPLVWRVATADIPNLKAKIKMILEEKLPPTA
ncbi:MAG: DUF86 domain-containing protein [Cyclobacteriaceae bacterium]|nr:DUF86 domain-containing protein [Cyclobacteriaceae bacterium]